MANQYDIQTTKRRTTYAKTMDYSKQTNIHLN